MNIVSSSQLPEGSHKRSTVKNEKKSKVFAKQSTSSAEENNTINKSSKAINGTAINNTNSDHDLNNSAMAINKSGKANNETVINETNSNNNLSNSATAINESGKGNNGTVINETNSDNDLNKTATTINKTSNNVNNANIKQNNTENDSSVDDVNSDTKNETLDASSDTVSQEESAAIDSTNTDQWVQTPSDSNVSSTTSDNGPIYGAKKKASGKNINEKEKIKESKEIKLKKSKTTYNSKRDSSKKIIE